MAIHFTTNRHFAAPSGADAVSVTPNATAWANSAYVEVLTATDAACVLTGISYYTTLGESSSVSYEFEIDVATGAAGAETVIATFRGSNVRVFAGTLAGPTQWQAAPVAIDNIASGARLAVRLRTGSTNTTAWFIAITYFKKPIT